MSARATPGSLLQGRGCAGWGPRLPDDEYWPRHELGPEIAEVLGASLENVLSEIDEKKRFLLIERLNCTSHAAVYAALDHVLMRQVAIKIHRQADELSSRRALTEARHTSNLSHPNIVQLYDLGEHEGWVYCVMELCEEDMSTWAPRHPWRDVVARMLETAKGLAELHAKGIIHSDLKPANILVLNRTAKVADFGLAGSPGWSTRLYGTPGFIAPEVIGGLRSRSGDIFSLGCTAWACLFGNLPFGPLPEMGDGLAVLTRSAARVEEQMFSEPTRTHPDMPDAVIGLVKRSLAYQASERPTASDWVDELKRVLAPSESWPAPVHAPISRPTTVGWTGVAMATGLVSFCVVLGTLGLLNNQVPEETSENETLTISKSPCATALSIDVSIIKHESVQGVCLLIREGEYLAASSLWSAEMRTRRARVDEPLGMAGASLVVARTFASEATEHPGDLVISQARHWLASCDSLVSDTQIPRTELLSILRVEIQELTVIVEELKKQQERH